jgi:hypothetical protein
MDLKASEDSDYKKLMKVLEDGHGYRRSGYIHARGMMDKGDQGWLTDLQERANYGALTAQENERRLFQSLQVRPDHESEHLPTP